MNRKTLQVEIPDFIPDDLMKFSYNRHVLLSMLEGLLICYSSQLLIVVDKRNSKVLILYIVF